MTQVVIVLALTLVGALWFIASLRSEIKRLRAELEKYAPQAKAESKNFAYLAVGNSLTRHGECSYWWNEDCGMAASTPEHDYFHLVSEGVKKRFPDADCRRINFWTWETQTHDRAETLGALDSELGRNVKLITVQLGENVKDTATFEPDLVELLEYLKKKAPDAEIIVVGDFWDASRNGMRRRAAEAAGCRFADLAEIIGKKEYQCSENYVVYGKDGAAHKVEHPGVAAHPGDAGMKYIADAVLAQWR